MHQWTEFMSVLHVRLCVIQMCCFYPKWLRVYKTKQGTTALEQCGVKSIVQGPSICTDLIMAAQNLSHQPSGSQSCTLAVWLQAALYCWASAYVYLVAKVILGTFFSWMNFIRSAAGKRRNAMKNCGRKNKGMLWKYSWVPLIICVNLKGGSNNCRHALSVIPALIMKMNMKWGLITSNMLI